MIKSYNSFRKEALVKKHQRLEKMKSLKSRKKRVSVLKVKVYFSTLLLP